MRGPQPLATGVSSAAKMPIKDYFEVQEVDEEVLTEEAKHAKVIEFVYQVRYHVWRGVSAWCIRLEKFVNLSS